MIFQPILPIPLFGEGKDQWKMINRPTIPFVFSAPVPTSFNNFDHDTGIGDMTWPMLLSPPAGNWMLGLGPTWLFPTATKDSLGREQFGIGPTGILGYKTKKITFGVFPQYFFKVGSIGNQADKPDASFMNLLYFGFLNLPEAWQIGFNPVITYNHKATSGNKWNVPIGLVVAKTTAIGKRPVKFQFGFEYSVVSQDDFGKRFMIKLNVIPVDPGARQEPDLRRKLRRGDYMVRPPFSYRFATPFAALVVAVAAAFFLGTAELSHADEIEPEPVTDAPVAETGPQARPIRPACYSRPVG